MVDLQRLVDQGYRPCGRCAHLVAPGAECSRCPRALSPADRPGRSRRAPGRGAVATPSLGALGGLAALPGFVLDLRVLGTAVTQGSMEALAPGVVRHGSKEHARKLTVWRESITAEARARCGPGWVAANCPVRLDLVFTLARPKRLAAGMPPATRPDLDKLVRAVCDALSPVEGFKVLAEDSRIVGFGEGPEKTYAPPWHTHDLALPDPGVLVRVYPAVRAVSEAADAR